VSDINFQDRHGKWTFFDLRPLSEMEKFVLRIILLLIIAIVLAAVAVSLS
jgi:hypothetical protein